MCYVDQLCYKNFVSYKSDEISIETNQLLAPARRTAERSGWSMPRGNKHGSPMGPMVWYGRDDDVRWYTVIYSDDAVFRDMNMASYTQCLR